ncbi:hypothetical protein AAA214_02850 [Parabacteroides goldsteinii]|uniref:hypothetical protein n=1 Tax=Parabacteroides goldsteinii TaxID=328812 RepID=UPI0032C0CF58
MVQQIGNISNSILNDVNVDKNKICRGKNDDNKIHSHKGLYSILVMTNILSIVAILIHFVNVDTISNDSYIGIIATLMGICATFIVGFQIYNSIEYKSEIQALQKIQERYEMNFKEMESRFNYEVNEAYIGIYIVQGITFKDKSPISSLKSFLKSIVYSLNVGDIKRANVAIGHIKTLAEDKDVFNKALQMSGIRAGVEEVRTHISYECIEDQLDKLFECV